MMERRVWVAFISTLPFMARWKIRLMRVRGLPVGRLMVEWISRQAPGLSDDDENWPCGLLALLLDHDQKRIGDALRAILRVLERGQTACVHCTLGKDRTGAVIALVLLVAGLSDDDVVREYALTHTALAEEAALAQLAHQELFAWIGATKLIDGAPAGAMRRALGHLRDRYGGHSAFLSDRCGFDFDMQRRLRVALQRR